MILLTGAAFLLLPILLILMSSTHPTQVLTRDGLQLLPGRAALRNYSQVLSLDGGFNGGVSIAAMLRNSLIVGLGVATLTTIFSLLSAYAIVFFRMRLATALFWLILATLLFPLESRFITTFQITNAMGLINSYTGLILPVLAVALGTFFFRQYFRTLPKEYIEAAIMDGAGPFRFLADFVIPLSLSRAGAVFTIAFMIGWNQYLWPLMISTDDSLYTVVRGIRLIGQNSGPGMAMVSISILPPFLLLLGFQRYSFRSLKD